MTSMFEVIREMLLTDDEDGKPHTRAQMIAAVTPDAVEWLCESLIDNELPMGEAQRALVARLLATAIVDTARRGFEEEAKAGEAR
jgi:hypothetical protein